MPLYVTPTPISLSIGDSGNGDWTVNALHAGGAYAEFGVLYLYRQSDNVLLAAVNPGGSTRALVAGEAVYAYACDPKSTPGVEAAQISDRYPAAAGVVVPPLMPPPESGNRATADTRGFTRAGRKSWINGGNRRR